MLGINAIVIHGVRVGVGRIIRLNHFPLIRPNRRSQRRRSNQPDGGIDGSPHRTRIVKIILAVEVGDVRRPEITSETGYFIGRPRRRVARKNGAGGRPVAQVGGCFAQNTLAIAINEIVRAILDQSAGIMQRVIAIQRKRAVGLAWAHNRQPHQQKPKQANQAWPT